MSILKTQNSILYVFIYIVCGICKANKSIKLSMGKIVANNSWVVISGKWGEKNGGVTLAASEFFNSSKK